MSSWGAQRRLVLQGENQGEPLQDAVIRALRSAAIVAYARPFLTSYATAGSSTSAERLTLEDLGYDPNAEYSKWWHDLHHVVLGLRNKFIAHADTTEAGRDAVVRACREPSGALEIHVEVNNYFRMLEELDCDLVWRLFDIVEQEAQRLAYRLAESLMAEGHLASDLGPDGRSKSLVLRLRRGPPFSRHERSE